MHIESRGLGEKRVCPATIYLERFVIIEKTCCDPSGICVKISHIAATFSEAGIFAVEKARFSMSETIVNSLDDLGEIGIAESQIGVNP
jgi:hypothetical protein